MLLDDVRYDDIASSGPGSLQTGPSIQTFGVARFVVRFEDDGTCTLRGLPPGRHCFRAFPDTIQIEPVEVLVGSDTPEIELSWTRR